MCHAIIVLDLFRLKAISGYLEFTALDDSTAIIYLELGFFYVVHETPGSFISNKCKSQWIYRVGFVFIHIS